MDELDLRAIWGRESVEKEKVPSVFETARAYRQQSISLVARIRSTAQTEHRIFLIAAVVGLSVLLLLGLFYWALALTVFAILMTWKYTVEIRMLDRIQPESNTLEYLQQISRLLKRYMRSYRIGILAFVPLVAVSSILLTQWYLLGRIDWDKWQQPGFWIVLAAGIALGILFSRWWLRFWVNTLYGRKLRELREMMEALAG